MSRRSFLLHKHWVRFGAALALVLVSQLGYTSVAHAIPQELTITPTSVSQVIQPGTQFKSSFQILNRGESSYNYRVYATSYRVKGEVYTPDFTALNTKPNVPSWFTFDKTTGYIKPGQVETINYTISMPTGTPPSGYYATIFTETQYPKSASGITLNQRVGEIFYLQAAGKVQKSGSIASWQVHPFQVPPLTATLRMQNTGGVHYPATVNIQVEDIFGRPKYKLSATKEVLPQTIRRIDVIWQGSPPIGLFKVVGSVSYLDKHETLATHWVLVMSPFVRIIIAVLIGLIIVVGTYNSPVNRVKARKRATKKAAKKASKEAK